MLLGALMAAHRGATGAADGAGGMPLHHTALHGVANRHLESLAAAHRRACGLWIASAGYRCTGRAWSAMRRLQAWRRFCPRKGATPPPPRGRTAAAGGLRRPAAAALCRREPRCSAEGVRLLLAPTLLVAP